MQVEINGDAEKLIQASIAAGKFRSAEEAVAAMAKVWLDSASSGAQALPRLSPSTDIHTLIARQGIRPFGASTAQPDFWPQDESIDDFLVFLADTRSNATPRPMR